MEQPFVMIYSIAFERFELGFELYSTNFDLLKFHSKRFFFDTVFDSSRRVRTRFECIRSRGSPFTSSVKSELRIPSGTFTSPIGGIWNVHEFHMAHMKHPFDMFYSIAFERFEPGSSGIRPISTHFDLLKYIQKDISFDTVFDTVRIRFEPRFESIRSRFPSFTSFN